MSSKVIKWFKRQASIRRHSDKNEDKESASKNTSEEKRKSSFPRLSFRKKNKKKASSVSELPGENLAVVGISKKYSLSIPQEMESEARSSANTKGFISNSTSIESSSLTTSPSKTDGYRSVSELSYHSSFDYSKETNGSLNLEEKDTIAEMNENSEVASKTSIYDNTQTFHSVNSSVSLPTKDHLHSVESKQQAGFSEQIAPIVRMEEICDVFSDKEHPDEEFVNNKGKTTEDTRHEPSTQEETLANDAQIICDSVPVDAAMCDISIVSKESDTAKKCDEADAIDKCDEKCKSLESNVFEEIDKLVRQSISLVEDTDEDESCVGKDQKLDIESENNKDFKKCDEIHNMKLNEEEPPSKIGKLTVSENLTGDSETVNEDIAKISTEGTSHNAEEVAGMGNLTQETVIVDEKKSLLDILIQTSDKLEVIDISESTIDPDILNKPEIITTYHEIVNKPEVKTIDQDSLPENHIANDNFVNNKYCNQESVQITITKPSPLRFSPKTTLVNEDTKVKLNIYPKELNPFGDDDSDHSEESNGLNVSSSKNTEHVTYNRVTASKENSSYNKENACARHTNINSIPQTSLRYEGSHLQKNQNNSDCRIETPNKSLNPFDDSDDDDVVSSNPFEDDENSQGHSLPERGSSPSRPPHLPPKSVELQQRLSSRGFLAPIPHPRRSKQSHHGSYTSLQNVPTYPVPAPRSVTAYGSTRTLNESTNPFDDDDDDESTLGLERGGLGRCSMQVSSSISVHDSFDRSNAEVRGSLPPSSRVRIGRKKRKAPLPPGYLQNKGQCSSSDHAVFNFPRKRSSTSPATDFAGFRKTSPSKQSHTPHGLPPPRPPPPKI